MPLVRAHIHTHEQRKFHVVISIFNLGKKKNSVTDFILVAFSCYSLFIKRLLNLKMTLGAQSTSSKQRFACK